MIAATLLICTVIAAAIYFSLVSKKSPYPVCKPSLPVFGSLLDAVRNMHRKHDWLLEKHEQCGETYLVHFPQTGWNTRMDVVMTSNVDIIEHILKTEFKTYDKGPSFSNNLRQLLGDGIFACDGAIWKSQRKIASRIFTINNFKTLFADTFSATSKGLVGYLDTAAANGEIVDLASAFFAFTLDSFGIIAFGTDFGCLDHPKEELPFAKSFDAAQSIVARRFLNPFWGIYEFCTGERNSMIEHLKVIDTFAYDMIKGRRAERLIKVKTEGEASDLIDYFMNTRNEDGSELDDKQLRDVILNFIIAGRDTTAQALAWGIWLLEQHPLVKATLRKEFDTVLGKKNIPSHDEIKKLSYAHAVLAEILRLYPSVPGNIKESNKDDILPDGTHLPTGSKISFSLYAMGRLERIWGPDAKEFRPERWIQEDKTFRKEGPFKWPAFHAGPRTCLGQQLATDEAITVLCVLLQKFEFELVKGQHVVYCDSLTLPMKNGLKARVRVLGS